MVEAKAVAKYMRISPNKARQVADVIRGKSTDEALAVLRFMPKRAAGPIEKCLRSAIANAEHNYDLDGDSLYVVKVYVDQGPTLKRYKPRAFGRADLMRRRTSHITVVVSEKEV